MNRIETTIRNCPTHANHDADQCPACERDALRAEVEACVAELQRCYDALGENDGTEIHRVTAYKALVNPNCVADSVHATMSSLRGDAAQTRAEALEEAAEAAEQLYSHLYGNGAEKQASRSIASAIRELKNARLG